MPRKIKLSGAQERQLRAQRERDKVAAAARAAGLEVRDPREIQTPDAVQASGASLQPPEDWAADFEAIEPDLENPHTDLAYVRRVQLLIVHQMATTARPSVEQREFWKRLKDMCATVGMTHPRAVLEADVKHMKAQLATYKQQGAVEVVDGSTVALPATARGQRGTRRPRPLRGLGPCPRPGRDDGDDPLRGGPVGPA